MAKKLDVIGTGWVPCNKKRWRDAKLVLYRPGCGIVSVEFMDLQVGDRRDERDENGRLVDFKVRISEYGRKIGELRCNFADGESYDGIVLYRSSTTDYGFAKRSWPSGDIRELARKALRLHGWNVSPKRYFLLATAGDFWNRPSPQGAPADKDRSDE